MDHDAAYDAAYDKYYNGDSKMLDDLGKIFDKYADKESKEESSIRKELKDLRASQRYEGADEGFVKASKKMESIYDDISDKWEKVYDKKRDYMDDQLKKKLGHDDWDKAYKDAASQNEDIDSGKLSYHNSIWSVINDIEDSSNEKFSSQFDELRKEERSRMSKAGEEFLNDYFNKNNINEISFKDLGKISGKGTWNEEHQEYVNYDLDKLFDIIDMPDSNYSYDWDTNIIRRKK